MAEYIDRGKAIALIEEKQKELCPFGRYGRNYVYGSDREKYDSWDEIIDQLENIDSADVAPVVHGKWIEKTYETTSARGRKIKNTKNFCSVCQESNGRNKTDYCPRCGAKMDL